MLLHAGLEAHLSEAHRQAARLIRKESELGLSIAEFGASAERLGRLEDGALQVNNKSNCSVFWFRVYCLEASCCYCYYVVLLV